jgi:hypothetical protein
MNFLQEFYRREKEDPFTDDWGWYEEPSEEDLPELDKESEEKEDPMTDDWEWCEGETEQDLNEVAGDSKEADASSYSSMPALESEGSPTCNSIFSESCSCFSVIKAKTISDKDKKRNRKLFG